MWHSLNHRRQLNMQACHRYVAEGLESRMLLTSAPVQWIGNGHYYQIVDIPGDWETACNAASQRSHLGLTGHLATVTSLEESTFIRNSLPWNTAPYTSVWLGAYQLPQGPEPAGGWVWVTGEAWAYTNFKVGEPNNSLNDEPFLLLAGSSGLWNDNHATAGADNNVAYLVEYEPPLSSRGVTVITHGWAPAGGSGLPWDEIPDWTITMAQAILMRGGGTGSIFAHNATTGAWESINDFQHRSEPTDHNIWNNSNKPDENIVLIYDWISESNDSVDGYLEAAADNHFASLLRPAPNATLQAGAVRRSFLDIARSPQNPNYLNLHLIGHSRGAVLTSLVSRRIGYYFPELTIDQVTTLDPHPWSLTDGTAAADPFYYEPDPNLSTVDTYSNVAFADNYFRADWPAYEDDIDFDGVFTKGAYNLVLSESALNGGGGNYDPPLGDSSGYWQEHSDVHAWYYGTITSSISADWSGWSGSGRDHNGDVEIDLTNWYPGTVEMPARSATGYGYSRIAGLPRPGSNLGDKVIATTPAYAPFDGIFNGDFSFGNNVLGADEIPGWERHGGGGTGEWLSGTEVLELDSGDPTRTHNWLYLPSDADQLLVDYRIISSHSNDQIVVELVDPNTASFVLQNISASSTISWVRDYPIPISASIPRHGAYQLRVSLVDPSGSVGATVEIDNLRFVDATTPSVWRAPTLAPIHDSGVSPTDRITANTALYIVGTAEPWTRAYLYDGTTTLDSNYVDAFGLYSLETPILSSGSHYLTVKSRGRSGLQSAASPILSVTIDTVAATPAMPDLASSSDTGTSPTDKYTADNTPTIVGSAEVGSAVTIMADGISVGTGIASGGSYAITTGSLSDGYHLITAVAIDVAGNTSAVSSARGIEIDTRAPTDLWSSGLSIAENQPAQSVVGVIAGTDSFPGQSSALRFSLVNGYGDNSLFNIDAATGQLTSATSLDFESRSSYSILLRATDPGGLTYDEAFAVTVTNLNDPPVVGSFGKELPHDTSAIFNTADFQAAFIDQDIGDTLTAIRIASLPLHGVLKLGGANISINQELLAGSIASMTYTPTALFVGSDSFSWSASDGSLYSVGTGLANLSVTAALPAYVSIRLSPLTQDWTNTSLISLDNNWLGVPGMTGMRGDDLTSVTAVNPQTVLDYAGASGPVYAIMADQNSPNTLTQGGIAEFHLANPVVALQGSGTADAPSLLICIDSSGTDRVEVSYRLRDIDGSTDNATQPVALQYRIGESGAFVNVPAAFVSDATTGPSLATLTTLVRAHLPAVASNQLKLQLRIITSNASGVDEWVGVDDISVRSVLNADANTDNRVNTLDFNILAGNFGQSGKLFADGDFSGDGTVDSADFVIFASQYGKSLPAAAALPGAMPTGLFAAMTIEEDAPTLEEIVV